MKNHDSQLNAVRALAAGRQPETDISELLFQHKCFYLLSKLRQPHKYTQTLKLNSILNQNCITERYRTCKEIFDTFHTRSIPYAVLKGAVLSAAAYGSPYIRSSGDIDILINRRDADTVKAILNDHGFVQGRVTDSGIAPYSRKELLFYAATSHQTAPHVKETTNKLCPYIEVDLNLDIMWGESAQRSDMDIVLQNTMSAEICGMTVHKLTPEMEFIALCLHHYKDMNSIYLLTQRSMSLRLFCDIYFYIKNASVDLDRLIDLCCKLDVGKYIFYCLYYADYIFEDSILEPYCQTMYSEEAVSLLNKFGLTDDERQEWYIDFPERLLDADIDEYFHNTL